MADGRALHCYLAIEPLYLTILFIAGRPECLAFAGVSAVPLPAPSEFPMAATLHPLTFVLPKANAGQCLCEPFCGLQNVW